MLFPPDPNNLTEIQRDDYVFKGQDTDTIEDDITVRQTSDSTGIYLGKTFEERSQTFIHYCLLKETLYKKVDGEIHYVLEVQFII
jgi:hypothetical protein